MSDGSIDAGNPNGTDAIVHGFFKWEQLQLAVV